MTRDKLLVIYNEVISLANLERKGKTMPYTSANGYMFSLINKDDEMGIRLSKADTIEFDTKYGAEPFKSHGATMREYVLIPEALLQDQTTLVKYLEKGYKYVMGLPKK